MNCMHGSGRGISVAAKRSGRGGSEEDQAGDECACCGSKAGGGGRSGSGLISSDPSDHLTNPGGRTSGKLPTGNREAAPERMRHPEPWRPQSRCGRPEAVERQTLSEDVTHADAPAPRILNVAARRAFKLAIAAPGLRDVRLRADAVGDQPPSRLRSILADLSPRDARLSMSPRNS